MSRFFEALSRVSAHPQFWLWAGLAIAVGILLGLVLVLTIVIRQRKQNTNSLMGLADCIGLSGQVEVPFDQTNSGKVSLQLENRTLACVAYSEQPHMFHRGDPVIVVGIKDHKVWVIPAEEFHTSDRKL